jgi:lipoprotein-releasing system ATP-binding protein
MNSHDSAPPLVAEGVFRSFLDSDGSELPILKGVDLEVRVGEIVAVTGASGAGKSTLLHILGGLDRPTAGEVLTALENIMLPVLIAGIDRSEAGDRAQALLRAVGLEQRSGHKPPQLSGGERQRVAVARALANEPLLLLADEPSGNLDNQTAEGLHELFFRLRDEHEFAVVLVTHNREFARRADRVLWLHDGQLSPISITMAEHETVS